MDALIPLGLIVSIIFVPIFLLSHFWPFKSEEKEEDSANEKKPKRVRLLERMNKPRKIIWTVYLIVVLLLFLRVVGTPKYKLIITEVSNQFWSFVGFGGVLALILHFIWGEKKNEKNK